MSRYIDADKLKEECYKFANDVSRNAMAFVQGQINAAPTADVVEIVRCRDCKHWEKRCSDPITTVCLGECEKPLGDYIYQDITTTENDYCSYGERREI